MLLFLANRNSLALSKKSTTQADYYSDYQAHYLAVHFQYYTKCGTIKTAQSFYLSKRASD